MSSVSKREFGGEPEGAAELDAATSGKVPLEHPAPRESGPQIAGASLFDDEPEAQWEVATRAGALGDAEVQALFQSTSAEGSAGADMSDLDFDDAPTRVGVSGYDAEPVQIPIEVAPVECAPLLDAEAVGETGIRPTAYRVFTVPPAEPGSETLVTHEAKAGPAQRLSAVATSTPPRSWWSWLVRRLLRLLGR